MGSSDVSNDSTSLQPSPGCWPATPAKTERTPTSLTPSLTRRYGRLRRPSIRLIGIRLPLFFLKKMCWLQQQQPFSPIIGSDIFGHLETFRDNSEDILTSWEHLHCFPSHFRPFSPVIGSLKKRVPDRPTDGPTGTLIEMRGRI